MNVRRSLHDVKAALREARKHTALHSIEIRLNICTVPSITVETLFGYEYEHKYMTL